MSDLSDNACFERENIYYSYLLRTYYNTNNARLIYDSSFDYSNSHIGISTYNYVSSKSHFNSGGSEGAMEGLISQGIPDSTTGVNYLNALSEDMIISATSGLVSAQDCLAVKTATSSSDTNDDTVGQLYIVGKHTHDAVYTFTANSVTATCSNLTPFTYKTTDSSTSAIFGNDDTYLCKYSQHGLSATVSGTNCTYDGEGHGVSVSNELEMEEQLFASFNDPEYYEVDSEGNQTKITGEPVDAGTYIAKVKVNYGYDTSSQAYTQTAYITSAEFTIAKRQLKAYISGKTREYNGSGYCGKNPNVATSSGANAFQAIFLGAADGSTNGVVSGDDIHVNTDNASSKLVTYGSTSATTGNTYNEKVCGDPESIYFSSTASDHTGYVLEGTGAANYEITAYEGAVKITALTHDPQISENYVVQRGTGQTGSGGYCTDSAAYLNQYLTAG